MQTRRLTGGAFSIRQNILFFNIGPIYVIRILKKPKNGSLICLPPEWLFVYFSSSVLVWGSSLFVWGPLCLFGFVAVCLGSSLFKTLTDDQVQNQLQKMV